MNKSTYDDSGLQAALKEYLDIKKNVDPATEVKRRAKNVCLRLVRAFKQAAPTPDDIKAVGFRVKVRPRIAAFTRSRRGKTSIIPRGQQVKKEIAARVAARTLTAAGWFPAAVALGANPKLGKRVRGQRLGSVDMKLGGTEPNVTMTNAQPGAAHTDDRGGNAMQKALDAETADMVKYIDRKHDKAARKAGL